MRITFLPFRPCCETGSSRVRVYFLQDYLIGQGIKANVLYFDEANTYLSHSFRNLLENSDILVFQKRYELIELAKKAKKRNVKIVLDMVDQYKGAREMLGLADVVTTDSFGLAEWYKKMVPSMRTCVIPDSIAYLNSPLLPREHLKKEPIKIAYFGSPSNMDNIQVCREALLKLRKTHFKLIIITGFIEKKDEQYFRGFDGGHATWSFKLFTDILQKCDFSILPQRFNWKGCNKLVQSITHNLPAISSDIPSYRYIAEQTGTEEFLCKTQKEWFIAMKKMFNPQVRNDFLAKTLNWTWNNYNMDVVGKRWKVLFEGLIAK